ncbi:MAG: hypothetical protein WD118_08310 [Phycisphaeraceae bacterium]
MKQTIGRVKTLSNAIVSTRSESGGRLGLRRASRERAGVCRHSSGGA